MKNKIGSEPKLLSNFCTALVLGFIALMATTSKAQATASQAGPMFDPTMTSQCVIASAQRASGLREHAVLDCVGRSAQVCFTTPAGDTTVGMMDCLRAELAYWDKRLNEAYAKRVKDARATDAEMARIRATTASQANSLRNMQRAWITFRDAACLYEQAQWMGGTGGGPATLGCHMHQTAQQALKLEGWWAQ